MYVCWRLGVRCRFKMKRKQLTISFPYIALTTDERRSLVIENASIRTGNGDGVTGANRLVNVPTAVGQTVEVWNQQPTFSGNVQPVPAIPVPASSAAR